MADVKFPIRGWGGLKGLLVDVLGTGDHYAQEVSVAGVSSGTVGNPSADVLTVQGDADGTPVPVSEPDTAAASAGEAVNISAADHTCSATTRALYVGGGGDVIATVGGVDLTFKDVPGGTILPIAATVIKDESTATYMVALW